MKVREWFNKLTRRTDRLTWRPTTEDVKTQKEFERWIAGAPSNVRELVEKAGVRFDRRYSLRFRSARISYFRVNAVQACGPKMADLADLSKATHLHLRLASFTHDGKFMAYVTTEKDDVLEPYTYEGMRVSDLPETEKQKERVSFERARLLQALTQGLEESGLDVKIETLATGTPAEIAEQLRGVGIEIDPLRMDDMYGKEH